MIFLKNKTVLLSAILASVAANAPACAMEVEVPQGGEKQTFNLSEKGVEAFYEAIRHGRVEDTRNMLSQSPSLAHQNNLKNNNCPPVIGAIHLNAYLDDDKVKKVLALLYAYGADFNSVFKKTESMKCDMTPLAYAIWQSPSMENCIDTLIQFGADTSHPTVDLVCEYMRTHKYLDEPIIESRYSLDRIFKKLGKAPLTDPFQKNTLKPFDDNFSVNTHRDSSAFGNYSLYLQPKVWNRSGANQSSLTDFSQVIGINIAKKDATKIEYWEEAEELWIFTCPVGAQKSSKNWTHYRFSEGGIPLALGVLTGKASPGETFNLLFSIFGGGFLRSALGDFLVASPGHVNALSMDRKLVLSDDLIHYLKQELSQMVLIEGNLEKAKSYFCGILETTPPLTSEVLLVNNYVPNMSREERLGYDVPQVIANVVVNKNSHGNHVLNVHSEILHENEKPTSECFVFDTPLSQSLCINVLCGIMAPKTVDSKLKEFFGDYKSTGLWNTSLGQFLHRAPGYFDWPDYSKRIVSEEIVKHFFPEHQ